MVDALVQGRHHDPHSRARSPRGHRPGATRLAQAKCTCWSRARPGPRHPGACRRCTRSTRPGYGKGRSTRAAASYRLEATVRRSRARPPSYSTTPTGHWPTLGDLDLHLFNEGRHRRLWEVLGATRRTHEGMSGTAFAVWAPNAKAVRVVGDWNFWDGRVHPMRSLGNSGVWELFMPGCRCGRSLQVRAGDRRRTADTQGGPLRICDRGPAWHGFCRRRRRPNTPGATGLDGEEDRRRPAFQADVHLRSPPWFVALDRRRRRRWAAPAHLPGAGRAAARRTWPRWASPTSSSCPWPSTPSAVHGATR